MLVDVSLVASPAEANLLESIPFVAAPADLAGRLGQDPGAGIQIAAELVAGLLELEGAAGCHLSPISGEPAIALDVLDRPRVN